MRLSQPLRQPDRMTRQPATTDTPDAGQPSPWAAHLICAAAMLIWSSGLPANAFLLPSLHPLALATLRLVFAAIFLLPFWIWQDGGLRLSAAVWLRGLGVGALIGLGSLLVILGQAWTNAVTVAVISAALPVVGLGVEIVLDGRKMTVALALGLGLALAGGILALGKAATAVHFGLGALLCLGSTVAYTLGSRWTITALPDLSPLGRCTLTLIGGAVVMSLIAAVALPFGLAEPANFAAMGRREWGALLVFVVGSLAFSQILWIVGVARLGIGMAALHINATPFYVMLIGLALGSGWNWWQAAGAALVGIGVVVAQGLWSRIR